MPSQESTREFFSSFGTSLDLFYGVFLSIEQPLSLGWIYKFASLIIFHAVKSRPKSRPINLERQVQLLEILTFYH